MSDSIDQLADALAKAQSEMPIANKGDKGHYGSYANLARCVETARGCLTKNGISITQPVYTKDGINYLMTIMTHKSGQYMSSEFVLAPTKAGRDALASDVTYWRRINFKSMVGLVDDNEIDLENEVVEYIDSKDLAMLKKLATDLGYENADEALAWLAKKGSLTRIEDMEKCDLSEAIKVLEKG